jgi:hypothetical protein
MPGEHPLDAAIIDWLVITLPDHPRQLARGERMSHGQPHDVLLDRLGKTYISRRPTTGMRKGAPIDQAEDPSPPKAPEIAPQPPIAQPREAAVRGEGPLLPSHGLNYLVARERIAIGLRITEEEVKLEHTSRRLRHRFLLPHQQSAKHVREGSYYAQSRPQSHFKDRVPIFCRINRSHPYRQFADTAP